VIRLSILVQGGALRAPLAGPFLTLPGKAGMRADARSRRPAETTASDNRPDGNANLRREPSPGRQVSGMVHEKCDGAAEGDGVRGAIPSTSRRAISSLPEGKAGNVPFTQTSSVALRERADRATPGRRDGTVAAVLTR